MHNAVGMAVLGPCGRLISSVSPESTNLLSCHRFSLHSEVIEGGNGGEVRFVGEVSPYLNEVPASIICMKYAFPPPDRTREGPHRSKETSSSGSSFVSVTPSKGRRV